jgi:hypothetical protein
VQRLGLFARLTAFSLSQSRHGVGRVDANHHCGLGIRKGERTQELTGNRSNARSTKISTDFLEIRKRVLHCRQTLHLGLCRPWHACCNFTNSVLTFSSSICHRIEQLCLRERGQINRRACSRAAMDRSQAIQHTPRQNA